MKEKLMMVVNDNLDKLCIGCPERWLHPAGDDGPEEWMCFMNTEPGDPVCSRRDSYETIEELIEVVAKMMEDDE